MTDFDTNPLTQADLDPAEFNVADLAALGEGHIAYVRAIRSDEVKRIFPQAPDPDARPRPVRAPFRQRGADPPRGLPRCDRGQCRRQRPAYGKPALTRYLRHRRQQPRQILRT